MSIYNNFLWICVCKCCYFESQVGEEGKVIGIDHIEGLVNDSVKNMKKKDGELLEKKIVELVGVIFFHVKSFSASHQRLLLNLVQSQLFPRSCLCTSMSGIIRMFVLLLILGDRFTSTLYQSVTSKLCAERKQNK